MSKQLITAGGEILKEVGCVALRCSSGEFLEAQPIYIKVSAEKADPNTKMLPQEEKTMNDIAAVFAEKMAQYVEGCKAAGLEVGF